MFFFNDTATTEIYTLSLHDALPIYVRSGEGADDHAQVAGNAPGQEDGRRGRKGDDREIGWQIGRPETCGQEDKPRDRKSTRLNSSHANISYAVFCLKTSTL